MRREDIHPRSRVEAQNLFLEVLEDLNGYNVYYETLPLVLKKICEFFSFGCAFVYESDHTNTFHLKENYTTYKNLALHSSFKLSDVLGPDEVSYLYNAPVVFFSEKGSTILEKKLAKLFDAGTLLLMSITDVNSSVVGCVGIVDRRNEIRLSESEILIARTLFAVLANRVKMRVYQQRALYTRTSLESIMDNTGIDVYVKDFHTNELLYANASMAKAYGGFENLRGKPCFEALHGRKTGECDSCPKKYLIDKDGNPTGGYSWDYQRESDGAWFRKLSAAFRWVDGRLAQVISSVDISESKKNEFLVKKMAFYDLVTDIPNRRKLEMDIEEFLASPAKDKKATLMFLDLDGFKDINDSFGHAAGDKLLISVAEFLQYDSIVKGSAYRYGGDEFLLFFTGSELDNREIAAYLAEAFKREWIIDGVPVRCGVSIGVARYPDDASDFQGLLGKADAAMYKAKATGKGKACFSDS